jgi:hypothetical protein
LAAARSNLIHPEVMLSATPAAIDASSGSAFAIQRRQQSWRGALEM